MWNTTTLKQHQNNEIVMNTYYKYSVLKQTTPDKTSNTNLDTMFRPITIPYHVFERNVPTNGIQ